ncbi:hypothetical protein, conserved [Angomonas deanei]|uniref:Uncharacterized protein n=1 Tax=Angomonas deanei TaxID=59799 RepID=A0A7G2CPW8_9TRYP|nr:hypothetical protein, conserved [Angomonas deanei]
MTKKHLGRGSAVRRSLGGLKHFYGSGPQRQRGCAVKPTFAGPYSRRDAFCGHYIAGASLESPTVDSIRTYTPQSCTKEVENLYLEVATLISIYCHTAKYLSSLSDL